MGHPHVVIVGAGFGGIDCARELVNKPLEVTLVDRHNFHTVEVRLHEQVIAVGANSVTLASGEVVPTRTVVWAAGVRANPLADRLGVAQTRGGRIVVAPDLRIPAQPHSFVIGDLAAIERAGDVLLPQVAQVAKQSGTYVGKLLVGSVIGKPVRRRFRYRDRGSMATIGRNAAVADLPPGIRLTGIVAWVAWLFLHLLYLVGFRNRLSVLLSWGWSYLTWDRGPRLILEPTTRPDSAE